MKKTLNTLAALFAALLVVSAPAFATDGGTTTTTETDAGSETSYIFEAEDIVIALQDRPLQYHIN
jgi:hypothetical protein